METMHVILPSHLKHPGQIPVRFASKDPRTELFKEGRLVIDLRTCDFIRPAAVLWCVVYPLLARQHETQCELLVPHNFGVCVYLKSLGLFSTLHSYGVEADDRGIPDRHDPKLILPLASFHNESEVEQLANDALDNLMKSGLGSPTLYPLVSEVFAELALNAIEHSHSVIGSFGFIQFFKFQETERFVCGIADGGIGIRRSLEGNPKLKERVPYDWVAIELAVRERISGTGNRTRGIGLYGVAEDMRQPGRHLILHSGSGALTISEKMESQAKRVSLFPGTMAYASIPT